MKREERNPISGCIGSRAEERLENSSTRNLDDDKKFVSIKISYLEEA
jgi:hypothetical protein